MISSLLVANRGEIAARIFRTAADLGVRTIGVYAEAEIDSVASRQADESHSLGPGPVSETYLNGDLIIDIAKAAGAEAIHPGYGFLSEIPEFAEAVEQAGITWIGPSPATIRALGDKIEARRTALAAGVTPVPGTSEQLTSIEEVHAFAAEHGYPFAAKKSDGGGGRGISVMRTEADLEAFEARYGSDLSGFFLEKFVLDARHVETQAMRDSHGTFAVASTRDCSVQRRNQKVIEEAPAPHLTPEVESTLVEASRRLFEHTDYVGVGTVEFLLDRDNNVYFLEVNPRLQVEHTVTEEVTGLDLVAIQLAIASGAHLPEIPATRGHSIELRITSEDPGNDLTPSAGTLTKLEWPTGHGLRIESAVRAGDTVSPEFDSMFAKLIVTAPTRQEAIARARRVALETVIEGVATPIPLLVQILDHPDFRTHFSIGTKWMEEVFLPSATIPEPVTSEAAPAPQRRSFTAEIDGRRVAMTLPADLFNQGGAGTGRPTQPRRSARAAATTQATGPIEGTGVISAPMQAIIVAIPVVEGQEVAGGDVLLVLESMKMEKYVRASAPGRVTTISVAVADNVPAGTPLLTLEDL